MKYLLTLISIIAISSASAQLKPVAYADGSQKLNGFSIQPSTGNNKAGILILPAWKGIDIHAKNTAEKLAAAGYYAFVADIYGEGNYPADMKKAGELSGYYKKNVTEYRQRIKLALDQLIKAGADPAKIVVIGFCFGGTGALEAARADMQVKGVVSFHGGLANASAQLSSITPKILVLHGADDPNVPEKEVLGFQQEMRTAKADWQMIYYANAVHSFTDPAAGNDNSKGAAYNELAAKRSWEHMMIFLKEVL
ncbi:MAG: dienelactone hydrolase family protein [Pedobacter sp.]|nr:MAG: dienelactone hydrolase family protein [Pedobacter sp.]